MVIDVVIVLNDAIVVPDSGSHFSLFTHGSP